MLKLCICHIEGSGCRLFIFTTLTIHTAEVTAMRITLHQEIPYRRSVNTDDLFHTFSGLCTTLLLPSRQMSLNKLHHSDTKLCFHCMGGLYCIHLTYFWYQVDISHQQRQDSSLIVMWNCHYVIFNTTQTQEKLWISKDRLLFYSNEANWFRCRARPMWDFLELYRYRYYAGKTFRYIFADIYIWAESTYQIFAINICHGGRITFILTNFIANISALNSKHFIY